MSKKQTFAGFDQDSGVIRGVRLSVEMPKGKGVRPKWKLLSAEEITGDFVEDVKIVAGLKKLRDKMKVTSSDKVSICLSGKQTYAIQMDVRRLPDDEMAGMLKLELRKSMPFEASAATFDFQFLPVPPNQGKDAGVPVLVSAASNAYLARHVQNYDRAGLKAYHVDTLPIAVANAFWATRREIAPTDDTHVILHVGSTNCLLVIDGGKSPFFNRSFSFNISDAIRGSTGKVEDDASSDVALQMNILASEITKSVTYYKNTFQCGNITAVTVMGNHVSHPAFDTLGKKLEYEVRTVQTAQLVHSVKPPEPGKYDLAVAIAMQAAN